MNASRIVFQVDPYPRADAPGRCWSVFCHPVLVCFGQRLPSVIWLHPGSAHRRFKAAPETAKPTCGVGWSAPKKKLHQSHSAGQEPSATFRVSPMSVYPHPEPSGNDSPHHASCHEFNALHFGHRFTSWVILWIWFAMTSKALR